MTNAGAIVTLSCNCPDCRLPFAFVEGGTALIVESRHYGQKHANRISIEKLAAALGWKPPGG